MKPSRLRRWSEAVAAVAGAVACIVTARTLSRWGATSDEASRSLTGDDDVALPLVASTRAVTIHAPAEAVWPWLVQMGWRRAGWYSYDSIDNDHIPSADHLVAELQAGLHVGDFVPEGAIAGWTVKTVDPGHLFLLTSHGPMIGVDWIESRDSSWLFLIEAMGSERSRLIERSRTAVKGNPNSLLGVLAGSRFAGFGWALGDFGMAHRHMNGIKLRAEREWRTMSSSQAVAART
jgi:hypothetical protein